MIMLEIIHNIFTNDYEIIQI